MDYEICDGAFIGGIQWSVHVVEVDGMESVVGVEVNEQLMSSCGLVQSLLQRLVGQGSHDWSLLGSCMTIGQWEWRVEIALKVERMRSDVRHWSSSCLRLVESATQSATNGNAIDGNKVFLAAANWANVRRRKDGANKFLFWLTCATWMTLSVCRTDVDWGALFALFGLPHFSIVLDDHRRRLQSLSLGFVAFSFAGNNVVAAFCGRSPRLNALHTRRSVTSVHHRITLIFVFVLQCSLWWKELHHLICAWQLMATAQWAEWTLKCTDCIERTTITSPTKKPFAWHSSSTKVNQPIPNMNYLCHRIFKTSTTPS